jgi:hypothetical protein
MSSLSGTGFANASAASRTSGAASERGFAAAHSVSLRESSLNAKVLLIR